MICSQINEMLDLLMDDALSEDMRRELEDHARVCPECAENIRATIQLKEMLSETDDEVDVPLHVQAGWRKAVKQEAARQKNMRIYRLAGFAAAVLVLAFGIGMTKAPEMPAQMMMKNSTVIIAEQADAYNSEEIVADAAVIQADGQDIMMARGISAPVRSSSVIEYVLKVESVDKTCDYISDLIAEYEGSIDIQAIEGDYGNKANLYISLPVSNASDFMNAIKHLDVSGNAIDEFGAFQGEIVSLLIVIEE